MGCEYGRRYNLRLSSINMGTFIHCTVRDLDPKKHCLIVPEGKGRVNGWALLDKKFRSLGISFKKGFWERKKDEKEPMIMVKGNLALASYIEVVDLVLKGFDEEVRIILGKDEVKVKLWRLDCSLVGWWKLIDAGLKIHKKAGVGFLECFGFSKCGGT